MIEPPGAGADHLFDLRRIGVTAAALVVVLSLGGCSGSGEVLGHSCTATDKRFLATASTDVTSLGLWTADYQSGQVEAEDVAAEAFDAARRVSHVEPQDPSLRTAQKYLDAMLTEYGEGMRLQGAGKEAGDRMFRAYGLANFARDVLAQAQPELLQRGCDVSSLL